MYVVTHTDLILSKYIFFQLFYILVKCYNISPTLSCGKSVVCQLKTSIYLQTSSYTLY